MLSALKSFCLQQGVEKTYWIAYSGGVDSHVLLHLCYQLKQEINIQFNIIHVNHSLSPNADAWVRHCEQVCKHYQFNLLTQKINLKDSINFEASAREARYAVFAKHLQLGDVLFTAHHQDDQAETVLLQLLRGAGLKGLASMPVIKPFAQGFHARPLLSFSRAIIQAYALQHQLSWIQDESNDNHDHARNFLRHRVMPVLTNRWPAAAETFARSARHCAEAQTLIEELSEDIFAKIRGTHAESLSVKKLLQHSQQQQRHLLRQWINLRGYPLPDNKKLLTIQHDVLLAKWDRLPSVSWGDTVVKRYRDDIFVLSSQSIVQLQSSYQWDMTQPLILSGLGLLQSKHVKGRGLKGLTQVEVRFRQGGESVEVAKRGRHTLKNLFQEWHVLPWERDRLPLIIHGQKLIAAIGYFIDSEFVANENEAGLEIELIPRVD